MGGRGGHKVPGCISFCDCYFSKIRKHQREIFWRNFNSNFLTPPTSVGGTYLNNHIAQRTSVAKYDLSHT